MCSRVNSIIKASLAFVIFSLFAGNYAQAEPAVSGISGTLVHGGALTISGSGFGTKSTATPLVWENFEWGNDGDHINSNANWIQVNYESPAGSPNVEIDTAKSYGVDPRSAYYLVDPPDGGQAPENEEFGFLKRSFVESEQVYVSYMARIEETAGSGSRMWKMGRIINWSANPSYHQPPYMGITWWRTELDSHYDVGNGQTEVFDWRMGGYEPDTWKRVEMWMKLSTPADTANGELEYWADYYRYNPTNVTITRTSAVSNEKLDTFISSHSYVNSVGGKYEMWMDDLYIDNTKARVEICDSSSWSARTRCEIQVPTSWASGSIEATINRGNFSNFNGVYLYIIDANGNVSNSGEGVALCSSCPNPPTSPQAD